MARQPIFDHDLRVVAYEVLFRGGLGGALDIQDGSRATASVLVDSISALGLERLTGDRPAWVNMTREVLLGDYVQLFRPDRVVAEVLEDVAPEPAVIEACKRLRTLGYGVAIDDVIERERLEAFRGVVDTVKVDWLLSTPEQRKALCEGARGLTLLAEKIEDQDALDEARGLGCTLFQGYFFAKPQLIRSRALPSFMHTYLGLLATLQRPRISLEHLEHLVRKDVALSYRLLRYVNSAWYQRRKEITSVGHALRLLGQVQARRWVTLVTMAALGQDKAPELLVTALTRARFCEVVAQESRGLRAEDLFFVGLFSVLDALVDRPMVELVEELSIGSPVGEALLGMPSPMRSVLELILAWEQGEWRRVADLSQELRLGDTALIRAYLAAAEEASQLDMGAG